VGKSNAEKCFQQKSKVVENLQKTEQLVELVEFEILTDTYALSASEARGESTITKDPTITTNLLPSFLPESAGPQADPIIPALPGTVFPGTLLQPLTEGKVPSFSVRMNL
jgi:hypothetical protein